MVEEEELGERDLVGAWVVDTSHCVLDGARAVAGGDVVDDDARHPLDG